MSRAATGTVEFRCNPPRGWARVTRRNEHGNVVRPWVDLERPDLKNTPEDKATAKRVAAKRAKKAARMVYVGKTRGGGSFARTSRSPRSPTTSTRSRDA